MTEFLVQDQYRRVVFDGDLLARASSRRSDRWRWTELTLYRTVEGTYILEKIGASRVMHIRQCPEVIEDLPRFQEVYPGEDPDDSEFLFCDCVPDTYDFPSLLVEKDRPWVQINDDPLTVVRSLMRNRNGSQRFTRAGQQLLERASEVDDRLRDTVRSASMRIA